MKTKTLAKLTDTEKKTVLAGRAKGKSIKAIAKEMHISDKRISAFLRQTEGGSRERETNRQMFDRFLSNVCAKANDSVNDLVAAISFSQLTCVEDILAGKPKSEQRKGLRKALDAIFDTFLDAALNMAVVAMWTMPAEFKKLWLANVSEDPKRPIKK